MDQRRLVIGIVVGLLVLGLLGAWSASAQQDAWTQGYLLGRLSSSSEGGGAAGLAPYLYPGLAGGFGRPRFGPFGFIFPLLFLGLGVFLVSRFFRIWAWRHHGPPWGYPGPGRRPWGGERGSEGQFGPPWARPEGPQPPTSEPAPQTRPEPGPPSQQPGPTSYV